MTKRKRNISLKAIGLGGGVLTLILMGTWAFQLAWESGLEHPKPDSITPTHSQSPLKQVSLWIGDSYTAGAGASESVKRTSTLVANYFGLYETNIALGGTGYSNSVVDPETARKACGMASCPNYSEQLIQNVNLKADIIFVCGGRNDSRSSLGYLSNVSSFYSELRHDFPKAKIFAVSPILGLEKVDASFESLRKSVKEAAKSIGATYLDIGDPLLGRPDLISSDGVHPNDDGHKAVADAIILEAKSFLKN